MNEPRRRAPRRRSNRSREVKPADVWRSAPRLPDPQPVTPVEDPTALLRSLGDPPLPGNRVAAGHYLASVVERAAMLATGLAATADLLAAPDDSSTEPGQQT